LLIFREEPRPAAVPDSPFRVELDTIWAQEAQNLDPRVPIIKTSKLIIMIQN